MNNCLFQPANTCKKAVERILELKVARGQRGGIALIMLIAFMVLAVPTVVAANMVADQLVRSSMVYNERLTAAYAVESGVELAMAKLLDEEFRDALVPGDDSVDLPSFEINGKNVDVTITVAEVGNPLKEKGADIALVLDNSSSVYGERMDYLKAASHNLVDAFDLEGSDGRIRMGVVRFATRARPVVEMTDVDVHGVDEPLHVGINGLYRSNSSNIVAALKGGADLFDTGMGDQPDAPNLIMLVTDGNDPFNGLPAIENAAASSGAEVFAIGVAKGVSSETLSAIAYDPNPVDPLDPDAGHVFHVDDFSELVTIIDQLVAVVEAKAWVYAIESVTADGITLRAYARLNPDGTVEVVSYQGY